MLGALDPLELRTRAVVALEQSFAEHAEDVVFAYLFGSVARGDARSTSDLDVAIMFDETPPSTLEALPTNLALKLGTIAGVPVDLVVLNRAPPDLAKRVLRDGILVLDRDRSRRLAFEVRVRNDYWDMQPVWRRYRLGGAAHR
jgi:predicted nucleotidyltransferase